ncbi:peptidoglycan recognition protein family protein [Aureispira anguillae]|uniref:N-acetylmuramoyl-L-alanine amidase n=1 Tax=Aureispira anguillae TaxID=2864201 RepID=A0A916DV21_9BACT|nr:peptidoglycan recognition family protein [Aureispira anguillae]BDS12731.1 N-acetylmuramoyl-L-alanine amidase [Aureispira anguillae]
MIVLCNSLTTISYGVENNNTPSINICLSGNFTKQEPSPAQLKSLKKLIAHLRKQLPQELAVTGHRDYKATSCPGSNLYKHLHQFQLA